MNSKQSKVYFNGVACCRSVPHAPLDQLKYKASSKRAVNVIIYVSHKTIVKFSASR